MFVARSSRDAGPHIVHSEEKPMIAKFFNRGRKQSSRRMREIARRQAAERQRGFGGERLEARQLLAATVGLITNNVAEAFGGYTLFAPSSSTTTYLIDQEGREVNRWASSSTPMTAELLPDGSLIRATRVPTQGGPNKQWAPGTSGRVEKFDWDGNLTWSYTLATQDAHLHHDFEVMPNGNVLMIAWERKTYGEAVAAGRDPNDVPTAPGTGGVQEIWPDMLIEVRPNQPAAGQTTPKGARSSGGGTSGTTSCRTSIPRRPTMATSPPTRNSSTSTTT
jgi:hypothetical protein